MRYPGLINFDISIQKEIFIKERARIQLGADAFNIFNHANFTGENTTLNFNAYPNTNGIVNGSPTALGRNANGSFNVTGFDTVTSPAAAGSASQSAFITSPPKPGTPSNSVAGRIISAAGASAMRAMSPRFRNRASIMRWLRQPRPDISPSDGIAAR